MRPTFPKIWQRTRTTVIDDKIGSRPNFVRPRSEWEGVAVDHIDYIVHRLPTAACPHADHTASAASIAVSPILADPDENNCAEQIARQPSIGPDTSSRPIGSCADCRLFLLLSARTEKTAILLIPEFCPGGQRQRLTVNKCILLCSGSCPHSQRGITPSENPAQDAERYARVTTRTPG